MTEWTEPTRTTPASSSIERGTAAGVQRKRALFVTLSDEAGGAERILATLALVLAKDSSWEVDIYVVGSQLNPSFIGEMLRGARANIIYGPFKSERYSLPSFVWFVARMNYDLVFSTHTQVNSILSAVRHVRRGTARRLVTRESTVLFDRFSGARRLFYKACYGVYGAQDIIIAQTSYMGDHISAHLPQRARGAVKVMGNPLDLDFVCGQAAVPLSSEDAALLSGRDNVIFCGRLIEVKHPQLAISTFAELKRRKGSSLRLVMMGDGPLKPELLRLAEASDLSDDIVFLGQRPNPYQIMAACQYGILTSRREGFPNVLLEMMACGVRKVVTTACAGDLELMEGVSIAHDGTPEELADLLEPAIIGAEDHRQTYARVVAARSVSGFLREILTGLS